MKASIIDDLATCRNEIRDCLNRLLDENYAGEAPVIEDFESGEDFLSRFLPEAYDIIFIDQYMDGLSGIGAAERIRSARFIRMEKTRFFCGKSSGAAKMVIMWKYIRKSAASSDFTSLLESFPDKQCSLTRSF